MKSLTLNIIDVNNLQLLNASIVSDTFALLKFIGIEDNFPQFLKAYEIFIYDNSALLI